MTLDQQVTKFKEELAVALNAADLSRSVLLNYFGNLSQVEEKFQAGLVSEADRKSEEIIVQEIKKKFPTHSILGEESGLSSSPQSKSIWLIDPLDGTTNYVHQFPIFCSSIGLQVEGEMVVAVVDAPALNQRFVAVKGCGATLNGQPIHVASRKNIKEWLVGTGFSVENEKQVSEQAEIIKHFVLHSRGIRRAGAAAYDLCMVAAGIFDGFWEMTLNPWDTAAGLLLVEEAGGIVTNMKGLRYTPDMPDVVAGSPDVHPELMKIIAGHKS